MWQSESFQQIVGEHINDALCEAENERAYHGAQRAQTQQRSHASLVRIIAMLLGLG
jgi:hypothetical protein